VTRCPKATQALIQDVLPAYVFDQFEWAAEVKVAWLVI
jgi:hypothetical protein